MKKLISVIIPVYNVKNYLKSAIDSVLLQKDFLHEIIIVDDGSTDGSTNLLIELYSDVNKIKIVKKENGGQGLARNLGTDLSTGEFIYYLDSDDLLKPGLFKHFLDVLESNPTLELFCFSAESFLDENFSEENVKNKGFLSDSAYKRNEDKDFSSGEEAFQYLYTNKSFFAVPYLYIFKKSILLDHKISFRQIKFEDEEFSQQLFIYAGKTSIIKEVYYKRRVREGSAMQKKREFAELLGYFKTIETFTIILEEKSLQSKTKTFLRNRIITFIRNIIMMKAAHKIKMNLIQRKYYVKKITPYAFTNPYIMRLFLTYSLEYRLRELKQKLWNN